MTYVRKPKIDNQKKIIICLLIGSVILLSAFTIYKMNQKAPVMDVNNEAIRDKAQGNEIRILRAARDINAGEQADASKLELISVPKELVPAKAVLSMGQVNDKRLCSSLGKGEFLLEKHLIDDAVWYEDGDRLIEHTFQDGAIPAAIDVGSVVDIKLFRHKAVDDIVVAKAVVVGKKDNTLSFYLNSAEQENIKEANTEGLIFLVQYLNHTQPESVVTYKPAYSSSAQPLRSSGAESFANSSMKKQQ